MNTFIEEFESYLDFYYSKCPDTLAPLLMLASVTRNHLYVTETAEKPKDALCSLDIDEILLSEWAIINRQLMLRGMNMSAENKKYINVEFELDDSLQIAYRYVKQYDEVTIKDQHHRLGSLDNHSHTKFSDQAHKKYATITFAEFLIGSKPETLKDNFIILANTILERSKIQPARPRLQVADTIVQLLQYDGKGTVYNPFSGIGLAAAMLHAGNNLYADGSKVDSDYVSAMLVNYGAGGSNLHVNKRDSSQWINWLNPDYVICTYLGYVGTQSAFDFCLSHCLETFDGHGRMVAMISPNLIFDEMSDVFKKALRRNWIDTIVLLPYAEVAVLVDASRPAVRNGKLKFIDMTNPFLVSRDVKDVLNDDIYYQIVSTRNAAKKGYLRYLIEPEIKEIEGKEIVTMRDLVTPIYPKMYDLTNVKEEEHVMLTIDSSIEYQDFTWFTEKFAKRTVKDLFEPAISITEDCLVVNTAGNPEPMFYCAERFGQAFLVGSYAFKINNPDDYGLIHKELNEEYVKRQLHPYGYDAMVTVPYTIEQFLDLKLYKNIDSSDTSFIDSIFGYNEAQIPLEPNTELINGNLKYKLIRDLNAGGFGITYVAEEKNLLTNAVRKVVLKELYPSRICRRDGLEVVPYSGKQDEFQEDKEMFQDEAKLMSQLGSDPANHIMHVDSIFESQLTKTWYYVMEYYKNGSLEDMIQGNQIPPEHVAYEHIIKPVCKALEVIHANNIVHRDFKPDNILIDDNGLATLCDFGLVKEYDKTGMESKEDHCGGTEGFESPEQAMGTLSTFAPKADVYALAVTVYLMFTNRFPPQLFEYDSVRENSLRKEMTDNGMSQGLQNAVVKGLQVSANLRPTAAQFLSIIEQG